MNQKQDVLHRAFPPLPARCCERLCSPPAGAYLSAQRGFGVPTSSRPRVRSIPLLHCICAIANSVACQWPPRDANMNGKHGSGNARCSNSSSSLLCGCYGLRGLCPPQNSCIYPLTPTVMVFGGGAYGGIIRFR